MIDIVHNAVAGRARYKVKGLYRRPSCKEYIERTLSLRQGIESVSANILTGNVLVLFDPHYNPRLILTLLHHTVAEYLKTVPKASERAGPADRLERKAPAAAARRGERAKTKRRLKASEEPLSHQQLEAPPWHAMTREAVVARLKATPEHGLSAEAVQKNLKKFGLNIVPEPSARSSVGIFIDQFKSLPVGLLGIAAGLSIISGGVADAIAILAVVGINAVIGFATESKAESTINSLKTLVRPSAVVKREGTIEEIPAEEVLVGDILILKPGTYVTADARLLENNHLSVDESVLTGESMPVTKSAATLPRADMALSDRTNMMYAGTLVTGGQGAALVTATGRYTEMGKVTFLVAEAVSPETPVERELKKTGNQLVVISSAICGLVFLIGLLRGSPLIEVLKTSISLAVAAVPEGLPAVATTTLALGINCLRRNQVLVRDLDAVCTLGSVQTVCLDKTGTVTLNRMSVVRVSCGMRSIAVSDGRFTRDRKEVNPYTSDDLLRVIHACVLCNETEVESENGRHVLRGSPTENALVQMAVSSGVDVGQLREQYPRLETNYRTESRLYMSTYHKGNNGGLIAVKGSPLEILAKCTEQLRDGTRVPLTDDERDWVESQNEQMAADALRVLGVAYAVMGASDSIGEETGLIWLGLVGMADPIREGVQDSIKALHKAGLETVLITGDQSATAYAVGRELDLNNGKVLQILDSSHLNGADPELVQALSRDVNVFSKVSPSHKLQIVQALQGGGKIVAMTGDGINDGPALKAADVGIAMGVAGTDVAREVADVVLEKDDLETLIIAVSQGRTIYNNIRKTIHFLLSTNLSEILLMTVAGGLGLGYPLNPMQLLWINLVSDIFPGLALALESPEPDVLSRPPRDPQEPILKKRDLKRLGFEAATITLSSLAAYVYGIVKYGRTPAARTMAFQTLTVSQILHALSCRSETHTVFEREALPPNRYLSIATIGSLGLQFIVQVTPALRRLLGLTRLGPIDGIVTAGTALVPLFINEFTKKAPRGDRP
ncbi:MAG: HAD-IC family P-type ATPase [Deltaproteobacteria bacterium]